VVLELDGIFLAILIKPLATQAISLLLSKFQLRSIQKQMASTNVKVYKPFYLKVLEINEMLPATCCQPFSHPSNIASE
jgi:hypothetical protein